MAMEYTKTPIKWNTKSVEVRLDIPHRCSTTTKQANVLHQVFQVFHGGAFNVFIQFSLWEEANLTWNKAWENRPLYSTQIFKQHTKQVEGLSSQALRRVGVASSKVMKTGVHLDQHNSVCSQFHSDLPGTTLVMLPKLEPVFLLLLLLNDEAGSRPSPSIRIYTNMNSDLLGLSINESFRPASVTLNLG